MINAGYKFNISLAFRDFKPFYRGRFLLIKRKDNNLTNSRIGVLLSKKNSKKAVQRVWIKRTIFSFFKENKTFLDKYDPKSDFLIFILTTASDIKDNKEAFIKELKDVISI
jgi:ribonuclease P protein component